MTEHSGDILHYLPRSSRDELWGVVCTTAGHQHVPPGTDYPVSRHPAGYHFSKGKGRVLDEFQLVYITAGRGRFESASCPPTFSFSIIIIYAIGCICKNFLQKFFRSTVFL